MLGRTNTGGGGAGLNFKVVGNSQPANPKENTIWVETDVDITSWIFSATQPGEPEEGRVWITTGISSSVEFNALKKNGIQVYPISAKQYVGGAWVDKTAKSYQGGKWVDWVTYLYSPGNEWEDITGGWGAYALKFNNSVTDSPKAPTVSTLSDGTKKITYGTSNGGGVFRTNNKVNLKEYSTLEFTGYMYSPHATYDYVKLCLWSSMGSIIQTNIVASIAATSEKTVKTFPALDLSNLNGEYYIGFSFYANYAGTEILLDTIALKK